MESLDIAPSTVQPRKAHYLFYFGLIAGAVTIAVYLVGLPPAVSAHFAFVLPVLLAISVYLAGKLVRSGESSANSIWLLAGLAFIIGGAMFDIAATIYHSPDLSSEANPVARALLDSGYSVTLVYVLGGLCQGLYILLLCLLWMGLLKHWGFLLAALHNEHAPMAF